MATVQLSASGPSLGSVREEALKAGSQLLLQFSYCSKGEDMSVEMGNLVRTAATPMDIIGIINEMSERLTWDNITLTNIEGLSENVSAEDLHAVAKSFQRIGLTVDDAFMPPQLS